MSRRTERVEHVIQREISTRIQRDLSDVRLGFVTISRVECSEDFSLARINFTVLGSEKEEKSSLAALKSSANYLRNCIARVLKTRTVPRLDFQLDRNTDHGFRIHEVLKDLQREEEKKKSASDPKE